MTTISKNKKNLRPNRNWIKPPNTIVRKGSKNSPQKLSYWTDTDNQVKLYTPQQLATCNILMNLNLLLVRALVLLDILKTLDDNAKIADLIHQDYAKFEASDSSVFNRFINLMAAVPDVTFGEFLGFISTNTDPKRFATMEKEIIKQVIKGKNIQVTNFYTSDRFRKK
jgi:hypothetical protein